MLMEFGIGNGRRTVTVEVTGSTARIVRGIVAKGDKYAFRRRVQSMYEHKSGSAVVCPKCGRGDYLVAEPMLSGDRSALCCGSRFTVPAALRWVDC